MQTLTGTFRDLMTLYAFRRVVKAAGTAQALIEARVKNSAYVIGEMVYSAQSPNFVYECMAAGTSEDEDDDGTHPVWPLVIGAHVHDAGTLEWHCRALVRRYAVGFGLVAKKAAGDNTGKIYVGDSLVDKTSPQQMELAAGEFLRMTDLGFPLGSIVDLTTIYVDAATNADELTGIYVPPQTIPNP